MKIQFGLSINDASLAIALKYKPLHVKQMIADFDFFGTANIQNLKGATNEKIIDWLTPFKDNHIVIRIDGGFYPEEGTPEYIGWVKMVTSSLVAHQNAATVFNRYYPMDYEKYEKRLNSLNRALMNAGFNHSFELGNEPDSGYMNPNADSYFPEIVQFEKMHLYTGYALRGTDTKLHVGGFTTEGIKNPVWGPMFQEYAKKDQSFSLFTHSREGYNHPYMDIPLVSPELDGALISAYWYSADNNVYEQLMIDEPLAWKDIVVHDLVQRVRPFAEANNMKGVCLFAIANVYDPDKMEFKEIYEPLISGWNK